MANQKQLDLLRKGSTKWNEWRKANPNITIDLVNADLCESDLSGADLHEANLSGSNLTKATLTETNLYDVNLFKSNLSKSRCNGSGFIGANLTEANLSQADLCFSMFREADLSKAILFKAVLQGVNFFCSNLSKADLRKVDLFNAHLVDANFSEANLSKAWFYGTNLENANMSKTKLLKAKFYEAYLVKTDFSGADLSGAKFYSSNLHQTNFKKAILLGSSLIKTSCVETNFEEANINNSRVYGINVWDVKTEGLKQNNLIVTKKEQPDVTVDDLEVAQFIYLLLNNNKIRNVIGTMAKKGVLILGRFTPERKLVLDSIRDKLRELDFLPLMFDFEKVASKDFTETIKILAGMSRFIIADISNPSSSPLELQATLPDYKIPFLPIIQSGERPFAMFSDLTIYPWCLDIISYDSESDLITNFQKGIIERAMGRESKLLEMKQKAKESPKNIKDL